jgi:hypothetical protein
MATSVATAVRSSNVVYDNQGEGFPYMQRCYSSFSIHSLAATCFGRTTIFSEKYISEITLLAMDPLFLGY